jgi:hypothetical protein
MNCVTTIPPVIALTALLIGAGPSNAAESTLVPKAMAWAYLYSEHPHELAKPAPNAMIRVPGSIVSYTVKEFINAPQAADWFPLEHPPMPDVVAKDWSPKSIPCAECHWPNGLGH